MSELAGSITAVILAAGGSTRLGRPKQLVRLGGERLLDRAVRMVREAGCVPVVVLGAVSEEIQAECDLQGCHVVINPEWQAGMGSSLALGMAQVEARGANAALVLTCDQPAVTADHLRRLIAETAGGEVVASFYAGRNGVPACFPASWFRRLTELRGDAGARQLLAEARTVELPRGELDIDTEETLQLAQQWLG